MDYVYRSQWDADGNARVNDCGPACVAMVLGAFGKGLVTINELSAQIMAGQDNGTYVDVLVTALQKRGVDALAWTGMGAPKYPAICLVKYAGFAREHVQNVEFFGWHWLLALSVNDLTVVCHDPDYWGAWRNMGAFKRYSREEWDQAFVPYGASKVAIVWPEIGAVPEETIPKASTEEQKMGMYTVKADGWANVREIPDNTSHALGRLLTGDRVLVNSFCDGKLEGAPSRWAVLNLGAGGVTVREGQCYVWSALLQADVVTPAPIPVPIPTPIPAPEPAGKPALLGVNVINYLRGVQETADMGCRAWIGMGDQTVTRNIRASHPEALVVHREYIADWKLTGKQLADRIGGGPDGVIYVLYNEGDNWSFGTQKEMNDRISYELEAAHILLDRGAKVALGGHPQGSPEFNTDWVVEGCKRYAELFNSNPNVYFDMHLYSPFNWQHILNDADLVWYERRWEFLYTRCGFDPKAGRKIIASETGLDVKGSGGFPTFKVSGADFLSWCRHWQAAQERPIVVNGVSYPSPFLGAMLFCYTKGTEPKWAGYDVSGYGAELKQVWS